MSGETRVERDSMGEVHVPKDALWAAQTQRAVDNFPISGLRMPRAFIRALGLIKRSAAEANAHLELLDPKVAQAVAAAALEVEEGKHDDQFPIDVFQTGSGTSSNMNANEVIANLASQKLGEKVHPNDHVNMGQSSNDVIPTAIHISAYLEVEEALIPALLHLQQTIETKAGEIDHVVTTGRTHLMDAMPVRMSQELGGWAQQLRYAYERFEDSLRRVGEIPQGGTAVGTGINAHPDFAARFVTHLTEYTSFAFQEMPDRFAGLSSQDAIVELSGQLRTLAVSMMKIANDLRWMNSGPQAGLAEIALPSLQPGSSIMPGKVNPVIPEAVTMVCAQVMGNDHAIAIGGQAGNFQLNVMLPMIAHNILQSTQILAGACRALADNAIAGFTVNEERIADLIDRNPILVTALNAVIGYDKGAAIAKKAYAEGRKVKEVAQEMTDLSAEELERLLDPRGLTEGGIKK